MRGRAILALAGMIVALVRPAAAEQFVVGVEELDYVPIYGIRDGNYAGAAREILDRFAKDTGHVLVYRPLPIKRLFTELVGGMIDFRFPDNPDWAAEQRVGKAIAYSQPVIRFIDGVMVRPEDKDKGPDAVKVLGMVAGFTPSSWLDRIKEGRVKLEENAEVPPMLKQVMVGRIDGAYTNVAAAYYRLEGFNMPGGLAFARTMPYTKSAYLLSSARRPDMIAAFDRWMTANTAVVEEIKRRTGAEKGID